MYEAPSILDTRCKKQEIRLSFVDIKILPTEQDSIHLASRLSALASGSVLILATRYLLLPKCRTLNTEC